MRAAGHVIPVLATGWFAPRTPPADAGRTARRLGFEALALYVPGPVGVGSWEELRRAGTPAAAVFAAPRAEDAGLPDGGRSKEHAAGAARAAARVRASRIVLEGSRLDLTARPSLVGDLGAGEPAADLLSLRRDVHAAAADRAVRALHGLLRAGHPCAIRNGRTPDALLGAEETEWLLSDLPALTLFFDPAHALAQQRAGVGPEPLAWADRFASRTSGVVVQGLGSDGAGRAHPADDGPDWKTLRGSLPTHAPWVFDLAPTLDEADVRDALRFLA